MKIFVRYGHSEEFPGTSSQYGDEVTIIREYATYVAQKLYYSGHSVMTFNPDTFYIDYNSSDDELNAGIREANNWGADLFVSCHVNATATGSLVCVLESDTVAHTFGTSVSSAVSNLLGISNEGLQFRTNLGELNYTDMPAIIIEPFNVDVQSEVSAYNNVGGQVLGDTIANAILSCI